MSLTAGCRREPARRAGAGPEQEGSYALETTRQRHHRSRPVPPQEVSPEQHGLPAGEPGAADPRQSWSSCGPFPPSNVDSTACLGPSHLLPLHAVSMHSAALSPPCTAQCQSNRPARLPRTHRRQLTASCCLFFRSLSVPPLRSTGSRQTGTFPVSFHAYPRTCGQGKPSEHVPRRARMNTEHESEALGHEQGQPPPSPQGFLSPQGSTPGQPGAGHGDASHRLCLSL